MSVGEEMSGEGVLFSITAYLKLLFVSCYLYYIYKFGFNRGAIFLFGLHTIVMFVDGSRSTYMPILFLTISMLYSKSRNFNKNNYKIAALAAGGLAMIVLSRAVIMSVDESLTDNMIMSMLIEGCTGSYMSLQAIYVIANDYSATFTFGATYLIDPFIWLIPQTSIRNNFLTFNDWVNNISPLLREEFAPMGGFYYIAESMAFVPYAGPVIITGVFALITVWIERNKNKYKIIYLSFFSSVGILFTKYVFGNVMKIFLIELIFLGLFLLLEKILIASKKEVRDLRPMPLI